MNKFYRILFDSRIRKKVSKIFPLSPFSDTLLLIFFSYPRQEASLTLKRIEEEIEYLKNIVHNFEDEPEVVFCHNDINCPNLIFDQNTGLVESFIVKI